MGRAVLCLHCVHFSVFLGSQPSVRGFNKSVNDERRQPGMSYANITTVKVLCITLSAAPEHTGQSLRTGWDCLVLPLSPCFSVHLGFGGLLQRRWPESAKQLKREEKTRMHEGLKDHSGVPALYRQLIPLLPYRLIIATDSLTWRIMHSLMPICIHVESTRPS